MSSKAELPSIAGENFKADANTAARAAYWTATTIAALIAGLAIACSLYEVSESEPVIPLAALLLAGAIWLIGWFCRHLLAR